jgi:hypothetical protein
MLISGLTTQGSGVGAAAKDIHRAESMLPFKTVRLLLCATRPRSGGASGRAARIHAPCERVVLQIGIISELPHGERPVAEHALNKPDDVFAIQLPSSVRRFMLTNLC